VPDKSGPRIRKAAKHNSPRERMDEDFSVKRINMLKDRCRAWAILSSIEFEVDWRVVIPLVAADTGPQNPSDLGWLRAKHDAVLKLIAPRYDTTRPVSRIGRILLHGRKEGVCDGIARLKSQETRALTVRRRSGSGSTMFENGLILLGEGLMLFVKDSVLFGKGVILFGKSVMMLGKEPVVGT
jgi:hypothetical protein